MKNARERQNRLISEKNELNYKKNKQINELNEIRGNIQVMGSKQRALENMENSLEGYARSVKELLAACKNSPALGKGIHGALAQLINVDKEYELAVEMALGGALQNVVTETEEDAKRAINFLKDRRAGRATFLPISSVNGRHLDEGTVRALNQQEGYIGVACDLVKTDPKLSGIILSLLGRVVVVKDIDCGIQIARKNGYSFRIVTLEGDILNSGGSMSGGSVEHRQGSILSRHREIADLKAELDKVLADKTIGILLITEKLSKEFPEIIDDIKLHRRQPLIVEIPDRHGTGRKPDFITAYVNEAIGLKL
jgi:chromosome segregation protein